MPEASRSNKVKELLVFTNYWHACLNCGFRWKCKGVNCPTLPCYKCRSEAIDLRNLPSHITEQKQG